MNKTVRFMLFNSVSKSLRQELHATRNKSNDFPIHKNEVPKPKTVIQTNGVRVQYEGP